MSDSTRIMLIDYELAFRDSFGHMLDREPDLQVVAHAGSLAEARDLIAATNATVDVALIELRLPDGSGTELLIPLQERFPASRMLALTWNPDRREHARVIAAGLAGALQKTHSLESIIAAVRRVGRGKAAHSPEELVELIRLASQARTLEDTAIALQRLTPRECEILQTLADGLTDREIADALSITTNTVAAHVVHILRKLAVHNRLQAVLLALKHNVVVLR